MTFENIPPWQPDPEPTPPNALERLMIKGGHDPSRHGEMFRMMLKSELFLLVPRKDLTDGSYPVGGAFEWSNFGDQEGTFVPVFTSEAVAETMVKNLPSSKDCAIAGLDARTLFQILSGSEWPIRIYASPQVRVILDPSGIPHLLNGDLTEARPSSGDPQTLTFYPILSEDLPPRLLEGVRHFCSKRRVPLGVYAFHVEDPESGEVLENNLHLILWLRGTDNHFYNDFILMSRKLTPEGVNLFVGVVTPDQTEQVEFLSARPPVWPVLEPVD